MAENTVAVALQYLSGVCDGARTLDGHGFNRLDTDFGKSLAERSLTAELTPAQQQ